MEGTAFAPIHLPDQVWRDPATLDALQSRDVAAIFHLARKYGISQQRISTNIGLVQGRVSQIMTGKRQVTSFELMERIAHGLNMPDHARVAFGLAPRSFVEPSSDIDKRDAATPARKTRKIYIPRRHFAR